MGGRLGDRVNAYYCHDKGGNQGFHYTRSQRIVIKRQVCLEAAFDDAGGHAIIAECHKENVLQQWTHDPIVS